MASTPRSATDLVAVWYGLSWLLLLACIFYLLARGHSLASPSLTLLLAVFAIFSILVARTGTRLLACISLTTVVVPMYLFEAYRWWAIDPERSVRRTVYVANLREQGLPAYPPVFPSGLLHLRQKTGDDGRSPIVINGKEVLPLAGIPGALTVYCQQADLTMLTYQSDAFGFRNSSVWERSAAPQFALLGDSFAQGHCVSEAFTYAGQLSVLGPANSYGINGTSVLTQLAIYREYVKALHPPHLLWFFYEGNDPGEYLAEKTWPLLHAYFKRDHIQHLVSIADPVARAMKRFINQRLGSIEAATLLYEDRPPILEELANFLLLRRAREALSLMRDSPELVPQLNQAEWQEISGIWREIIGTQRAHGGEITFVYIPSNSRFLVKDPRPFQMLEDKVITLWSDLDVDFVSLTESLEATENPLSYYVDDDLHFNEQGYRLTGEAVVRHLRRSMDRWAWRRPRIKG